jgi:hypothetical protein
MPCIATNHYPTSPRHSDSGSRYDAWESAVSRECERLNALAAPLFAEMDEGHESDIRDVIYDIALKIVDASAYPPNRHARRKADGNR